MDIRKLKNLFNRQQISQMNKRFTEENHSYVGKYTSTMVRINGIYPLVI